MMEINIYAVFAVPMAFFGGVELWAQYLTHYLVCSLLFLYVIRSSMRKEIGLIAGKPVLAIGVFLLVLLLSSCFSVNLNHSLRFLILMVDAVVVFLVIVSMPKSADFYERLLTVILSIGILHCVYAIYKPLFIPDPAKGGLYITGRFFNHNHFVAFIELLFFIPIVFLLLKRDMVKWKKYFFGVAAGLFALSVIMSISRGGLVSIVTVSLILSLMLLKDRIRVIVLSSLFFCR